MTETARPAAWSRTPAFERVFNHVATALVTVTGIAYAAIAYTPAAPSADPFAVVSHPAQSWALAAHVLVAPASLIGLGLLLRHHVLARILNPGFRRSRKSGWMLVLTAVPMIASGYLLQVSAEPWWRRAWLVAHLVASAAWVLGWILHVVSARRGLAARAT